MAEDADTLVQPPPTVPLHIVLSPASITVRSRRTHTLSVAARVADVVTPARVVLLGRLCLVLRIIVRRLPLVVMVPVV